MAGPSPGRRHGGEQPGALGTWLATGTFNCAATGGMGWLLITMGAESSHQIPVDCG
jgi:hypothetical protein